MQRPSVSELALLEFFGVEPVSLDRDVPWPYNDFSYEVARGEQSVSFAITPAYLDVHVILRQAGETVYELKATGVDDVRLVDWRGRPALEISLNARESLWLRVDPLIAIFHSAGC